MARVTLVSGLGAYNDVSCNEADLYAPPLGVLTLAAGLTGEFPVSVVDLDDHWRQASHQRPRFQAAALDAICATRPDILGFSSISGSYPLTIRLAQECSRRMPSATIVFGGPQATVTDTDTASAFPFVDLILRGECDDTFPALVTAIAGNKPVAGIPGLTFRDRGRIRRNPNGSAILDMDSLPLPAYELVPRMEELGAIALEIGRGCPYSCTFCSTNDFFRRKFRLKSPGLALEQMNFLHRTWGVTTFDLVHDMFTVDRRRVVAFCETMIAAGSPYKWSCSARTDSVDAELLRLMKDAGCHDIFFGIETGSRRMQRIIDKDLDLDQARRVLQVNNDLGIHSTASLIIGYPQETAEDLRDTVSFYSAVMLMPWVDPQLNVLSPLAATPITNEFRDQLTLDRNWTTISENGTLQDAVDRVMIAAHPDIFINFYAFPFFAGRDLLQCLRDFLFYGLTRCGGLMRALSLHTNDMYGVFGRWRLTFSGQAPEWYRSLDFVQHLILFAEANYSGSSSVAATARFYATVYAQAALEQDHASAEAICLVLAEEVYVVDCECDISQVLESLTLGKQPEPAALATAVTVAVRLNAVNRASIMTFPAETLDLLRHAEKGSAVSVIVDDFEERHVTVSGHAPRTIVEEGIDYLEELKLVRRILPDGGYCAAGAALGADSPRWQV